MQTLVLSAISNPVRIKLLCCLSKKNKNVQELIDSCGLTQSAVSQHLSKLKKAGLIKNERQGKFIFYSLTNSKTAEIANKLNSFCKEVN